MGQLGSLSPAASIAVGIIVGLLSTSIQSIGLTLQRKSHQLEDEKADEFVRRPPYRRRRWQLGMLMFIVSNLVGSTIQITTLPLPVLSTLQASGLVFNTICATLILGEPFTRWSLGGTVLVAAGALLIALYGAFPEPTHNLQEHLHLLSAKHFIMWMFGTVFIVVAIALSSFIFKRIFPHNLPRIRLYRGMSYGAISSIFSAHSLLVAKTAVELIVSSIINKDNQFNRWQSWMIVLLLVILALAQLYFLHRGLKLCSTSVLYPFVFCIYNIVAILDGLIYYQQTAKISALHGGLIAVGTVVLLTGVLALSWRLNDAETAPPPDAHTFLTPGMGLVEDTTTDDESISSSTHSPLDSEEEELALTPTEHSPLLKRGRIMTPTTKDNAILNATKSRRRFAAETETDAIWDELQDSERQHLPRLTLKRSVTQPMSKLDWSPTTPRYTQVKYAEPSQDHDSSGATTPRTRIKRAHTAFASQRPATKGDKQKKRRRRYTYSDRQRNVSSTTAPEQAETRESWTPGGQGQRTRSIGGWVLGLLGRRRHNDQPRDNEETSPRTERSPQRRDEESQ